jgi:hypothetical protein
MPVEIPVQATHSSFAAPLDLIAEVFWVTTDGSVAQDLGVAPVVGGVATMDLPPRPQHLRWAVRLRDPASAGAVYRSGPLARLPARGRGPLSGGTIRVHRGGGVFGLDSGDGAEALLRERLRATMPPPAVYERVELGSDQEGRYVLTLHGRIRVAGLTLAFAYRRALRIAGALDPGRPARAVVAWPEGPARLPGPSLAALRLKLDLAMSAAVEDQLSASALHICRLSVLVDGAGFSPSSASVERLEVFPPDTAPGVDARITVCAGTLVDLLTPPEHPIVVG